MKKEFSVKTIVAIGIGSAVFVILGRFAIIPTFVPNTNIETTYPFLALMAALFGPVPAALIGFIGHTLKDLTYGSPWWSWIICSAIVGAIYGWATRNLHLEQGEFTTKEMIHFNVVQVIGHAVVWGLIAPTLDVLIYSEAASRVYTQGLVSATVNSIAVGVIGTLLMKAYASTRTKKGSLTKD
ncbi:ECF-type riboflavin transporter substrate-binding protein [Enterococcus saccharolyticus]|uniref:ECF-type riboflavin transporter substrate-binding protein n=1 Tax=Enterococcus TaxID=1350 RepID=UPI001E480A38|nr:ECF-type riboflavin transporter substrate-binding protein [Enterococcus saccharolyticus]MCD5001374.1 ECF-type riboflavin transporter substrate-binding protein [Enterococcus saccharolyticus]